MKKISDLLLKVLLLFVLFYPAAYFCVVNITERTFFWKAAMLYVGLAPWSIGVFGIIVLLFWWASHLQKNWKDILSFLGFSGLGVLLLLSTSVLLAPFTP